MHNATDAVKRIGERLGSLGQVLDEDFWSQIQETVRSATSPALYLGHGAAQQRAEGAVAAPPLEVYVTADEVVVCAALPGLDTPEYAAVSLAGPSEFVVEAFIPPWMPQGTALLKERFSGFCSRTVTMPVSVLPQGAKARYEDGILEVRLRRVEPGAGSAGVTVLQLG